MISDRIYYYLTWLAFTFMGIIWDCNIMDVSISET